MKLRALMRDNDVCDVVSTLQIVKPGVREMGSFIATFHVKSKGNGNAVEWREDDGFVPDRVRFRLTESIIDSALGQLNGGMAKEERIELDSDGEREDERVCYVATIEKVGQFTRAQLEAMKWIWNMQATCRDAVQCCTWINSDVKTAWPYTQLRGFGFDLAYSDLFCFRASAWLNDNAIRAFAVYLRRYKNNGAIALPQSSGKMGSLPANTLKHIAEGVALHSYALLPVNFGGVHWGCLVIDKAAKQVKMYDSMGVKKNLKVLKAMASEIVAKITGEEVFTTTTVTAPMQSDGDNCGVFVCRLFWACVSTDAPSDVSTTGVLKLRWAMLHAILTMRNF
eukprot:jgi/Phyca11/129895/e_gw1.89.78.1